MQIHTILTHEHPDLDAIFCCYLLREYGEAKYPGISQARLQFHPAGLLPENKTTQQLEEEGVLPVDIGSGRLDTHPEGSQLHEWKRDLSAAILVAQDLGVAQEPSLLRLLEFARLQDSNARSLSSKNPLDHLISLPNLIRGGEFYFGEDHERLCYLFMEVIHAIRAAEIEESLHPGQHTEARVFLKWENDVLTLGQPLQLRTLLAAYLLRHFPPLGKSFTRLAFTDHALLPVKWKTVQGFIDELALPITPDFHKLVTFADACETGAYLITCPTANDKIVSLPYIIRGADARYRSDPHKAVELIFTLFECISAYERDWTASVEEYMEKKQIFFLPRSKVIAIHARHPGVMKVARWQDKPDLVIFQDEQRHHVGITLNRLGRLKRWLFYRLAARIRLAEWALGGEPFTEDAKGFGEICGWFLHQSGQLLLHGSPKGKRPPSRIPFPLIVELVLCEFDKTRKMPDTFCPATRCLHQECPFYPQKLPNCFEHRKRVEWGSSEAEKPEMEEEITEEAPP